MPDGLIQARKSTELSAGNLVGDGERDSPQGRRTDWRPQKAQNKAALLPRYFNSFSRTMETVPSSS